MGRLELIGFGDLYEALRKIPTPRNVKERMLDQGAESLRKEAQKRAETMLRGPYYKGDVKANVIIKTEPDDKEARYITFPHDKIVHDEKADVATIAFVNEYGAPRRNIGARPFIAKAAQTGEPEAIRKAQEVYEEYLDSIGL